MKTRFLQGLLLCVALVGFAQAEITPRIVGGEASGQSYSWMVSIQSKASGQHFCGGTLIARQWVVTAAHCTEGASAAQLQVVIGIQNLDEPDAGETFSVSSITDHSDYNSPDELDNDISLLKLSGLSNFDPIETISAANFGQLSAGDLFTTMGWGALAEYNSEIEDGDFPNALNEVQLPMVSPVICRQVYTNEFDSTDEPLCAGYEAGGKDSCQGDSGGPLIIELDGTPYLVGVVSWGYGCARAGLYGVYTNVSEYTDWLEQNMVTPSEDFKLEIDSYIIGEGKTTRLPLTFTNLGSTPVTISQFSSEQPNQYVGLSDKNCIDNELAFGDSCQIFASVRINSVGILENDIVLNAGTTFNFNYRIVAISAISLPFLSDLEIDWFSFGNASWFSPEEACELRSGIITDDEVSVLMAQFSGEIAPKFDIDLSSEQGYDQLAVYMDDKYTGLVFSGEKSEQLDFSNLELDDGDHRIMFVYTKDVDTSEGQDRAAITHTEFNGVLVSDDCSVDGESRADVTPESSITSSGGGGAAFYLLLPLMLLSFRFSKAPRK